MIRLFLSCAVLLGTAFQPKPPSWAEETLARLSLREKVAQLFAVQAYGDFKNAQDADWLRLTRQVADLGVGSVIFFQGDPFEQLTQTNLLQSKAKTPLLIAQDMEYGVGMRVRRTTAFPFAMALGATRNPDLAYEMGKMVAREAKSLGVHQNYAPVADVNNNPENPIINIRSYGEKPDLVGKMVAAYLRGMQEAGLIATVKHFPGHGDTATDSHHGLPSLNFDRKRLDEIELPPFKAAIEAGVQSVMVGHLALPQLETQPDLPATLSKKVIGSLLRQTLGFTGLIVTDSFLMTGLTQQYRAGEAAVLAIEAGVDMVLMSQDVEAAIQAVVQAVETGRISEERINFSARKILELKEKQGLHLQKTSDLSYAMDVIQAPEHQALATEIARQAFTLVKNENQALPLGGQKRKYSLITLNDDDVPRIGQPFLQALQSRSLPLQSVHMLDQRVTEDQFENALADAQQSDFVIVASYIGVQANEAEQAATQKMKHFLNRLQAKAKAVLLISFGSPYLTLGLQAQPTALAFSYSADPFSQQAAADAVLGRAPISGKLPVSIPNLYPYGAGLDLAASYPLQSSLPYDTAQLQAIERLIREAITDKAFPGAALAIGTQNQTVLTKGFGYFTYTSDRVVTETSLFDLASLTKVIGLTTAVMKLYEEGKLSLEDKITNYFPAFGQNGKDVLTLRHLMTHSGGLKAFYPFYTMGLNTREEILDFIFKDKLYYSPGSKMEYSDLDMIIMGMIVEKITGQTLDAYLKDTFYKPLGMLHTGFRPAGGAGESKAVVPTEQDAHFRKKLIQGEVHDECAWVLGGTSGHAGLFSTANDLAVFAQLMLNKGSYGGTQYLKPETIDLFTRVQDPKLSTRALGWDTKSPSGYTFMGQSVGKRAYGHTGFTGTSIWIDPDAKVFAILLTNRVHPTRENKKIFDVRAKLGDLVFKTLTEGKASLPTTPQNRDW